nr:MAG TPA: hypothetical protein [Caudoviricetes sp.]
MQKYTDFVKLENDSILVDCDDASKLVIALIRQDENDRVCKVNETSYDDYLEFVGALANQLAVMSLTKKKMTKCHFEIGTLKIFNFVCSKPLAFYTLVVIGAKGNFSDLKKVYDTKME